MNANDGLNFQRIYNIGALASALSVEITLLSVHKERSFDPVKISQGRSYAPYRTLSIILSTDRVEAMLLFAHLTLGGFNRTDFILAQCDIYYVTYLVKLSRKG